MMPDRRAKYSDIDRPDTVHLSAEDLPAFVQMFRVKQFFPIFRAEGRLFCFGDLTLRTLFRPAESDFPHGRGPLLPAL